MDLNLLMIFALQRRGSPIHFLYRRKAPFQPEPASTLLACVSCRLRRWSGGSDEREYRPRRAEQNSRRCGALTNQRQMPPSFVRQNLTVQNNLSYHQMAETSENCVLTHILTEIFSGEPIVTRQGA
jgi:hypothetical protein